MVFAYMWVADPLVNVRGPWVALPVVLILAVSVRHNMKTRAWGFSRRAFWPALGWSTVLTVTLGAALWFIGHAQGAPPVRPAPLLDFLYVVVWGGAQQFVLQTVILRESQHAVRRGATMLAAAIFASVQRAEPVSHDRDVRRRTGLVWNLCEASQHRAARTVARHGDGDYPDVVQSRHHRRATNRVALPAAIAGRLRAVGCRLVPFARRVLSLPPQ